jgi:hypothetical protein
VTEKAIRGEEVGLLDVNAGQFSGDRPVPDHFTATRDDLGE